MKPPGGLPALLLGALAAGVLWGAACGGGSGGGSGGKGSGGSGGASDGFCGDGVVQAGEECDDGNADDSDDCTTACGAARCGDGIVQAGEECDDGNYDDSDACVAGCVAATCGDGLVYAGVEECDDGNHDDGDACSSTCKAGAGCGNGVLEAGEECDDGNSSNADACLSTCKKAKCGDGYAQIGVEECDDGNANDTDFCTSACKINTPTSYGCPGIALTVAAGAGTAVTGDTTPATDTSQASCGGDGAAEIVYRVLALASGTLVATMTGINGGDPVLYARSTDCAGGPELACADSTFAGGVEVITFPVTAGSEYFIFADAYTGTTAEFSLDLHLSTGAPGDTCPGVPVAISMGNDVELTGDTSLAVAHYKGTGACATSASTKDVVYAVTPAQSGTLDVLLDPTYDGQLYARAGSCTTGAQLDCSETGGAGVLEALSFPVTAGNKYSVFVDGQSGSAGSYTVLFSLTP